MEPIFAVACMLIGSAGHKTLQYLREKNKMGFAFFIPLAASLLITAVNFILYKGGVETIGTYAVSFLILAVIIAVPVIAYGIYAKVKK